MTWVMMTEKETNDQCLTYLKNLIKAVESNKKILIRVVEESEMKEETRSHMGVSVLQSKLTGKDFIYIEVQREGDY